MRLLLTLLAALAFVMGPVAALAAPAPCSASNTTAAVKSSPAGAHQVMAAQPGDPCCDHPSGHDGGCAWTCAAAATLAIAPADVSVQPVLLPRSIPLSAPVVWVRLHDPGGLERPPKSIA